MFMKTLLDISQMDLKTAKRFYTLAKTEETDYNIPMTCYFLEQSIEKALKGIMDLFSIEYKFDHEIARKIVDIRNNKSLIKDYERLNSALQDLEIMANEISIWNSKPRYIINFMQTNRTIDIAMNIAEKLSSYIDTIKPIEVAGEDVKKTHLQSQNKLELIGKSKENLIE